jgi:hypothetical protein
MPLDQVHGIPRRRIAPDGADHLLPPDRPSRVQRHDRQHHPLLQRPEAHRVLIPQDPKRPEDAKPQYRNARVVHIPLLRAKGYEQT